MKILIPAILISTTMMIDLQKEPSMISVFVICIMLIILFMACCKFCNDIENNIKSQQNYNIELEKNCKLIRRIPKLSGYIQKCYLCPNGIEECTF